MRTQKILAFMGTAAFSVLLAPAASAAPAPLPPVIEQVAVPLLDTAAAPIKNQIAGAFAMPEITLVRPHLLTASRPANGTYTSGFEMRWGSHHNGADIANGIGTPILAALSGTVIEAGPASGYGQWVRIQHDDGTITIYGHINSYSVTAGQRVNAGDQIAEMGNLGFSTGPHLHFQVEQGGVPIDPVAWLAGYGISI